MYSILRKGCSSAFRFCRLFSNVRALVVWLLCWSAAQTAEFQVASTSIPENELSTVPRDAGYTDLDLETRFAAYQAVDKRDVVPESLISQAVQIGRETPWAAAGYFNASGSPLFFPGRSPRKCGYGADLNRVPFFVGDGWPRGQFFTNGRGSSDLDRRGAFVRCRQLATGWADDKLLALQPAEQSIS